MQTATHIDIMTRIQRMLVLATAFAAGALTHAQERLSAEQASQYAAAVGDVQAQVKSGPLATEADLKKPVALRDGEYGIMVLPDRRLSAEKLAPVGTEVVPVGQLWFHKLAPLVDGRVVGNDKLRLVRVSGPDGDATVPCFALGVRKPATGGLELVVYGKDKEPVMQAPLKAISAKQENPVEISAERDSDSGRVTVKILGQQEAVLTVTDPELY